MKVLKGIEIIEGIAIILYFIVYNFKLDNLMIILQMFPIQIIPRIKFAYSYSIFHLQQWYTQYSKNAIKVL